MAVWRLASVSDAALGVWLVEPALGIRRSLQPWRNGKIILGASREICVSRRERRNECARAAQRICRVNAASCAPGQNGWAKSNWLVVPAIPIGAAPVFPLESGLITFGSAPAAKPTVGATAKTNAKADRASILGLIAQISSTIVYIPDPVQYIISVQENDK